MPLTQDKIKQLTVDDLLRRIIEESSEIIQAACKFQRFGYDNYNPFIENPRTNITNLGCEFMQLYEFITELFERHSDTSSLTSCRAINWLDAEEQEKKYAQLGITSGT